MQKLQKGQRLQHITNETFQLQFNPRKLLKTPWPKKKINKIVGLLSKRKHVLKLLYI